MSQSALATPRGYNGFIFDILEAGESSYTLLTGLMCSADCNGNDNA